LRQAAAQVEAARSESAAQAASMVGMLDQALAHYREQGRAPAPCAKPRASWTRNGGRRRKKDWRPYARSLRRLLRPNAPPKERSPTLAPWSASPPGFSSVRAISAWTLAPPWPFGCSGLDCPSAPVPKTSRRWHVTSSSQARRWSPPSRTSPDKQTLKSPPGSTAGPPGRGAPRLVRQGEAGRRCEGECGQGQKGRGLAQARQRRPA